MGCQLGAMTVERKLQDRLKLQLTVSTVEPSLYFNFVGYILWYLGFLLSLLHLSWIPFCLVLQYTHTNTHIAQTLIHQPFYISLAIPFLQRQNRNTAYGGPRNQAPVQRGPKNSLLVSNLHHNVTEKDLYVSPTNLLP